MRRMPMLDCDTHLYEPRSMWAEHVDPDDRDVALRLDEDELGHTWLMLGDRRIHLAEVHRPGDVDAMGAYRRLVRAGERPAVSYDEALPTGFWDPAARRDALPSYGAEQAVVFPNFGLLWERPLAGDLRATLANMTAWNRWAATIAAEGRGALHPVAHVTLRDPDWLDVQLGQLAAAGVRLAMTAPALVDGKRLSHPDLDRVWAAFVHHGVTPVFHVSAFPHPFADGWYEGDPDPVNPVLSSVFLSDAAALSLADLAVHGVFERHPGLRIGVFELSAVWVPMFLLLLDGGFSFHARFNGEPLTALPRKPSDYIRDHVRVASFSYEMPVGLMEQAGDLFMACSDYPHAEGTATPLDDYRAIGATPEAMPGLFGENLRWLLRA